MIVFKTEQAKQIASFESWTLERKAWSDALYAIAEEVVGEHSFMSWRAGSFAGLPWSKKDVPPTGWKLARGKPYLVPDKRLKAGKDWAKRIDGLPKVSEAARCDGQPGCVFHAAPNAGAYMHSPQYHRFTDDGPLFMIWSCDCGKEGEKEYSIAAHVDSAIWESVKLSEFYAEVEAEKERNAAAKAAA